MALLEIFAVVICLVNLFLVQSVLHRIKEVADHVQKQFDEVLDRHDALENVAGKWPTKCCMLYLRRRCLVII